MSESDIRGLCGSPEQASVVIRLHGSGWDFIEKEEGGEIKLRNGGSLIWVKPDGATYP